MTYYSLQRDKTGAGFGRQFNNGGGFVEVDKCDEGLAVQVVRLGRGGRPLQLLHQQGEDEERGQKRVSEYKI